MPELVDYRGNPIKVGSLTKEIAAPNMASIRSLWYESMASSLTPELLATIISEVDQNDITNYLTLAEEMEERDLHYHSVLSTRKLAVSGLDAMVESYSDDTKDVKIADFVTEVIKDDAFDPLLAQQTDALGKGYAASEIIWDRTGSQWFPSEYKWRDQRHFQFDMETGQELRLRDELDMANGIPLEPYKFCVHTPKIKMGLTIRGGLARLAVVAYICKSYTLKDWMAFAEVFGMPLRVGKYDTAASSDQKAALLNAVATIGMDTACIIPESMMIEFVQTSKTAGGEKLFENLGNWLDMQVSKGVLGQTATTEGTPGRLGSDEAQSAVREDIKKSDAKQLSATLQRDLVKPLVDLNFGVLPRGTYPKLRLVIEEPEDLEALSKSLPEFIDRGLKVQQSVILDKFGLQEAEEDSDLLKPKGGASTQPITDKDVDNPDVPNDPIPENPEEALQREQLETVVELMRAVRRGEKLTPDQRAFLAAATKVESAVAGKDPLIVQVLIFSKIHFTIEDAKKWAVENGYEAGKVRETNDAIKITQKSLSSFDSETFKTLRIKEGIKAVVGKLKATTAAAIEPPDDENDEIDVLTQKSLRGWRKMMDPVLQPIIDHAHKVDSYDKFLAGLEKAASKMDSTEFAKRLAVATFKTRGLGDGTDEL